MGLPIFCFIQNVTFRGRNTRDTTEREHWKKNKGGIKGDPGLQIDTKL